MAADLLSQAEHGIDSQVILVSTDQEFIEATQQQLKLQLLDLPRKSIAEKALANSKAIYFDSDELLSLVLILMGQSIIFWLWQTRTYT